MSEPASLTKLHESSLNSLTTIRDEVQYLFSTNHSIDASIDLTLKKLFWYMGSRSQAVSFMASWGYIWDAEIILRSFYETAAKVLFICSSEAADKPKLVEEFWNDLGPVNDRRTAQKAPHTAEVFARNSLSASVFSMLQDPKIFDLSPPGNREHRKRLEKKWSFSEIIEALHLRSGKGMPLVGIKSLLHIYGMASHIAHADEAAMRLMEDIATRESEERKVLDTAHVARIFSDQVSISWFCADMLRLHFATEFQDPAKMRDAFYEPLNLGKSIHEAFDDSQREFYDDWKAGKV
jgi:hypothetical protein